MQAAGPGGFDALVRTATHGSGELELPQWLLPHGTRVSIPGVADLLIDVAHANVSGLDSFSKLELLEPMPSDAAGLSSAIEMGGLGVSLELQLSILGGGGRRQLPPLHVNLSLSGVSVAATGRLALDADGIGEMQLRQLANGRLGYTERNKKVPYCEDEELRVEHLRSRDNDTAEEPERI